MTAFNPRDHLIQLRGRGGMTEYLPVAARIAWFRAEHPDGHIAVEAHTITEQIAIFHARVSVPEGGSAQGWGSETPKDFGDFIEKASTKALGRALLALGYGTLQAGDELAEGERVAEAPEPVRDERADAAPAPLSPAPIPYTKEEYEAAIKEARQMQANGERYEVIVAYMRTQRGRFTPDQYTDSVEEMKRIRKATAASPAPAAD